MPPLGHLRPPGGVVDVRRARPFVERVEPGGLPTPSSITWPPRARDTAAHSPLGSPGTYTRRPKAMQRAAKRLGQRGLAAADLAGQEHVRVGQHPSAVQLPRVVAEGRARTRRPGRSASPPSRAPPRPGTGRRRRAPRWSPGGRRPAGGARSEPAGPALAQAGRYGCCRVRGAAARSVGGRGRHGARLCRPPSSASQAPRPPGGGLAAAGAVRRASSPPRRAGAGRLSRRPAPAGAQVVRRHGTMRAGRAIRTSLRASGRAAARSPHLAPVEGADLAGRRGRRRATAARAASSASRAGAVTVTKPVNSTSVWPAITERSRARRSSYSWAVGEVGELADPRLLGRVGDRLGLLLADLAQGGVGGQRPQRRG